MSLRFGWKEISLRSRGLTFDDVLITPRRSDVRSRRHPDLSSRLTKKITLEVPIISANMDTITESTMLIAMRSMGAFGILHRFMTVEEQVNQVREVASKGITQIAASVGVNIEERDRAQALVEAGVSVLTLDIAHGHSVQMLDMTKFLKDTYPEVELIAGNVATPEGTQDLIEAGADAIKVGIGPGSMCTTRVITGCGVPQLTAIALCAEVGTELGVPIIADGGLKTSGDIVKAFAAGADTVMLGSMLSGTLESPGEVHNGLKRYRGMASRQAQVSWRGELPEGMAPEGEATAVPVKGHVKDVVSEICGGIRSGMSYVNATKLYEIRENTRFMEMSGAGTHESHAHGLKGHGHIQPIFR